jgi:hypothetical protein
MRALTTIKIEGGVPRDERREILVALRHSPLTKVVLIGTSHPLGNSWGARGSAVAPAQRGDTFLPVAIDSDDDDERETAGLEAEDYALFRRYSTISDLPTPPSTFSTDHWTPTFGWLDAPPLLYTLALHHSTHITELKFCGYRGAPILLSPTPYTSDLFAALKFFPNLRVLTTAFWLTTTFEDEQRDEEVLEYWHDMRDPNSTALVTVPRASSPAGSMDAGFGSEDDEDGERGEENPWARELRTKFAPEALAGRVLGFIGPLLSPVAKGRPGGVLVRASFSMGGEVSAIFDLDLRIGMLAPGMGDVILEGSVVGPRTEGDDDERRREKERGRRWFW